MNKLQVKIPWWYIFFIKYMPEFYEKIPRLPAYPIKEYRGAAHCIGIWSEKEYSKMSKPKDHIHKAYLSARWKAYWLGFWLSTLEVNWTVFGHNDEILICYESGTEYQ